MEAIIHRPMVDAACDESSGAGAEHEWRCGNGRGKAESCSKVGNQSDLEER